LELGIKFWNRVRVQITSLYCAISLSNTDTNDDKDDADKSQALSSDVK